MLEVLLAGGTSHQNIIHIVETAIEAVQHFIHKPLESVARVPEAEGHAVKLEEAERGGDGCLGNIVRFHRDLVVCTYKINLAEDSGTMEGCSEILNVRNRVAIRDGMRVQGTIIATGIPVTWGLFGDHVEWGRPAARGGADGTQLKHVLELMTSGLKLLWCQAASASRHGWSGSPNVMCHCVSHGVVRDFGLCDRWDSQRSAVNSLAGSRGSRVGLGEESGATMPWMRSCVSTSRS